MSDETQDRPEIADEVVDRAEIRAGHVIVEYTRTEAALADLRTRYAGATFDLSTTAGDKAARAARLELKTLRTSLEARRKEFKAPALDFGQKIDAEAKRITAEIVALESPIDEQIKAEEQRREAERAAKAEAERQRVADIQQKIARIAAVAVRAVGLNAEAIDAKRSLVLAVPIGDDYAEFRAEAETVKAETLATLASMHAAALAAEAEAARLKAEQEAEADRLAAERAEQQRIAAEQAEQARKLAEQQAAIEAQAKAARAEIERQQAEAQAARDEADRVAREVREAEQRRIDEQRAELERQQAAQRAIEQAAAPTPAPLATAPVQPVSAPAAAPAAPAIADDPATLKLGTICERLGFNVSAAFLADVLHIQHAATDKRVMLYRESQWPLICAQLQAHVGAMSELYTPEAA